MAPVANANDIASPAPIVIGALTPAAIAGRVSANGTPIIPAKLPTALDNPHNVSEVSLEGSIVPA